MKSRVLLSCLLVLLALSLACVGATDGLDESSEASPSTRILPEIRIGETRYRGVNVALEMAHEADLRFLVSEWNANLVRVCLYMAGDWGYFVPEGSNPTEFSDEHWARLDQFLKECEASGLRVIIDLHQWLGYGYLNESSSSQLWRNSTYQSSLAAFWGLVAKRYAEWGDVIYGYDILNEPHASFGGVTLARKWQMLAQKATDAIREHDRVHAVVIDCTDFGNPSGFKYLQPIDDDNAIYSFHMWLPHEFTHQGINTSRTGVGYPTDSWNREWIRAQIRPVLAFRDAHKVKILVGEVGASAMADESDRARYFADCLELFEEYGFDYCLWSYAEWGAWSLEHIGADEVGRSVVQYTGQTPALDVWKSFLARNSAPHIADKRPTAVLDGPGSNVDWDSVCAAALRWRVDHICETRDHTGLITDQTLEETDVACVGTLRQRVEPREIDALEAFVNSGGGLLLYGSGECEGWNDLLARFGIEFDCAPICSSPYNWDVGSYSCDTFGAHPVCENVISYQTNWSGSFPGISGDQVLVWSPEHSWRDETPNRKQDPTEPSSRYPLVVARQHGAGRVVAFADDAFELTANYQLTYNALLWLQEKSVAVYLASDEPVELSELPPSEGPEVIIASDRGTSESDSPALIVAHRGASQEAPENTIPAFELAWEQGADAIEGDFRRTRDGHIVCIHDATTNRVADGDLMIRGASLYGLRKLDVGSYKGEQYRGTVIPTLAEVLATAPEGKKIYIEIKTDESILPDLLGEVSASRLQDNQIVIISFGSSVIREAKRQAPQYKALWLVGLSENASGEITPSLEDILETLCDTNADGVSTSWDLVDEPFVERIVASGFEYHAWTVNDVEAAERLKEWGAASITTDVPGQMVALRDSCSPAASNGNLEHTAGGEAIAAASNPASSSYEIGRIVQGVEVVGEMAYTIDWQTGLLYGIDHGAGTYWQLDTGLPFVNDLACDGEKLWIVDEQGSTKTYDITRGTLTGSSLTVELHGEVLGVAHVSEALYLLVYQSEGPRLCEVADDGSVEWFDIAVDSGMGELIGLQCIGSHSDDGFVTLDYGAGLFYRMHKTADRFVLSKHAELLEPLEPVSLSEGGVRGFFFDSHSAFLASPGNPGLLHVIPFLYRTAEIPDIDWLASINEDENPNPVDNYAEIINGRDGRGEYYGMAWNSPEFTDLSLNSLDGLGTEGAKSVLLTLSASEPMDVDVAVGVAGRYCGEAWRYASADSSLRVGPDPQTYELPYSAFSENPFGDCVGPLPEEALETVLSIILLPAPRAGELRVYNVALHCGSSAGLAIHAATLDPQRGQEVAGLEYMGNPSLDRYPDNEGLAIARTIWDIQPWNGQLYLGGGDAGINAGPVDVLAFDPVTGEFRVEFTVDDEQIEKYRTFGPSLYVPGMDATETWEYGNLYVKQEDRWTKLRTLPNAIHVYDCWAWDDRIIAVGANLREEGEGYYGGGGFYISSDGGKTWSTDLTPCSHYSGTSIYDPTRPDGVRFTELFEFNQTLYASGWLMPRIYEYVDGVFSYVEVNPFPGSGTFAAGIPCGSLPETSAAFVESVASDQQWADAFEIYDPCLTARITQNVLFGEKLVYIGGMLSTDHQWDSFGIFAASAMEDGAIERLTLPESGENLRDLCVVGNTLYLIGFRDSELGIRNRVYSTTDLHEWNIVREFTSDAGVYSMAFHDGWMYVGLGGDSPSSGRLYRFDPSKPFLATDEQEPEVVDMGPEAVIPVPLVPIAGPS